MTVQDPQPSLTGLGTIARPIPSDESLG
jgi:hypothetical protein